MVVDVITLRWSFELIICVKDPNFPAWIIFVHAKFPNSIHSMASTVNEYKLDMDDSFGDQGLLSPLRKQISPSRYSDPGINEWWYIFMLQFFLWWSLSSIFDSIPSLISISSDDWALSYFYFIEVVVGFAVYTISIPRVYEKARKFAGIVVACCGLWGCLTIFTNGIRSAFGIHPIVVYSVTAFVVGSLGIFHHNVHRQDYLLDQLL